MGMNRLPTVIVTLLLIWVDLSVSRSVPISAQSQNDKATNTTVTEAENVRRPKVDGFECPGEQGFYPHPENCELYYGCWDFQPTLRHCQSRQLFDMKYRGCNWPELTDCQDRIRPEGYPNTKTPPPPPAVDNGGVTNRPVDCPLELDDGMFPDSGDCNSYYRCVYGNSYHYKCAPPLVFNENIGACDYLSNVNCGNRPIRK
ncbi:putative chitinase 3 [Orchesella cincta]|uniref:Putative chitinase 3 n=1 Tax=Orchesella cincta TaxID=48709 RepID=A0A1D2MBA4_ORCCI|nr:putative chitinase 3 [Orchesella cincta]